MFQSRPIIASALLLASVAGCTQMMAEQKAMGVPDLAFMRNAAFAQQDEIAAAKIALEKTSNGEVKRFAQSMITDHSKAYEKLKMVADKYELALPESPDPTHVMMAAQLQSYNSPVFEKEYVASQVADHSMVLEHFKAKYDGTGDSKLKSFLEETIPTVEHHLKMAKEIQKSLK